jgi:hypothetical protein
LRGCPALEKKNIHIFAPYNNGFTVKIPGAGYLNGKEARE